MKRFGFAINLSLSSDAGEQRKRKVALLSNGARILAKIVPRSRCYGVGDYSMPREMLDNSVTVFVIFRLRNAARMWACVNWNLTLKD